MVKGRKGWIAAALALVVAGAAQADVARTLDATFTNDDARGWIPAFKPLLEADRAAAARDATAHQDRMDVAGLQLGQLQAGGYEQLLVTFELHREDAGAADATRLTAGVLPMQEQDKVSIASCGPLQDIPGRAVLRKTYLREQGKWAPVSSSYDRVKQCGAAAGLMTRG